MYGYHNEARFHLYLPRGTLSSLYDMGYQKDDNVFSCDTQISKSLGEKK